MADLSGNAHHTRLWPAWATPHISLDRPQSWLSRAGIDDQAVYRLTRPRVLLVALYHPEYFPLPRFPLGISDLARAARATLPGQVRLLDMQLGVTLDDILAAVASQRPDILERFNKETTAEQNALAIRTLSALGVPTRFTYITFDHLMTEAELRASYAFQGRTDLLLAPQPHLSAEAIVEGVRDPAFVAAHATGRPLYTAVSYLLVSMECLIGAAYTRKVQAAGLAGALRPSMGRQDAAFAEWRIGRCSQWAQRWVDRNFALDYTLKSLEKLLDGHPREVVRGTRVVIKDAAYRVLGAMLDLIAAFLQTTGNDQVAAMDVQLRQMLDAEFTRLHKALTGPCGRLQAVLANEHAALLDREFDRWTRSAADGWLLINAADPCGT